ncbi:hypothetical protein LPJ53_004373 [Coemansia erecta]|uniref:Uncharacterized protein n=1 Tax=Coemansia erecta TaxID=147472 RepID=A0A9W7XUG5_9FUNG|nr:hypothetical protein LPJ53_004373 [Coemansia erecta]
MNSPGYRIITRSGSGGGYAKNEPFGTFKCSQSGRSRDSGNPAKPDSWALSLPKGQSAGHAPLRFLTLPPQIINAIMRYATGVADLDPYIGLSGFSLFKPLIPTMASLVQEIKIAPTQICSRLRYELIPQIHQYAIYCGKRMRFLGRAQYRRYASYIIIVIPQNMRSFRSIARTMYWLPKKMRQQVRWVGLSMKSRSTISASEYGALSGAFPRLQNMFVEIGCLDASPRRIMPAIVGTSSQVAITAITIIDAGLESSADTAMLIHRCCAHLEYLCLHKMSLEQLCDVFWPVTPQKNADFSTRVLRPQAPAFCQFPMLEELNYEPTYEQSPSRYTSSGLESCQVIQMFFDTLVCHRLPCLKALRASPLYNIDCMENGYNTPKLDFLSLIVSDRCGNNPNLQNCTSNVISDVLSIKTLKALNCHAISDLNPKQLPQPYMSYVGLKDLCSLNLKHWPLRFSFLKVVVDQMTNLRRLQITLLPPSSHQPPEPRQSHENLCLRYVWINSTTSTDGWNVQSLDYLAACIVDMRALERLQLFDRALRRLNRVFTMATSVADLFDFTVRVKVGDCSIRNQDEVCSSIMEFN